MTSVRGEFNDGTVREKQRPSTERKTNDSPPEIEDIDKYSLRRCRNISPSYPPVRSPIKNTYSSSMRNHTAEDLFNYVTDDINTIFIAAEQSFSSAREARKVFQTTFDEIDHDNPMCEELSIYGVFKDLREETMKAVFDVERARLRTQKIASEMMKLQRGLRSLGMFRRHGNSHAREGNQGNNRWHQLYNYY
ncbi:hypothetical protein HOLleu_32396 [Holothuria leucospilota]|uniref:Uncharacterized protein n=1 Tax=Holothuria leucospilota TaxID=206669 RepID=A0A9Q1BIM2_HOLLE|nr:hypothetical protein HOLleu_32396 [Holothuria leucospilota]